MLEYIIDDLYAKCQSYFDRLIPIAEIVHSGEKSFPKEYVSNGNYRNIDPDNFAGVGYFRINGEINISSSSDN